MQRYIHSLIIHQFSLALYIDCDDVFNRGIHESGVQLTKPQYNQSAVKLYCDIDNEEERGWTVIQQRRNGEYIYSVSKRHISLVLIW